MTARRTLAAGAGVAAVALAAVALTPDAALAQSVTVSTGGKGGTTQPVTLLLLFGFLSILPGIVFSVTAFPRILITLSFLRSALGTPNVPPNQLIVAISLFLTLFVMSPTITKIADGAVKPYMDHKISSSQALKRAEVPLRTFMFKQTRTSDLALFVSLSGKKTKPKTRADIPTLTLIPAFLTSELKTAFEIGFMIFLPFLVIDLVIASTLLAMGMMMLPPPLISLPFKILLFVLVDGWDLVFQSLVDSFNTGP